MLNKKNAQLMYKKKKSLPVDEYFCGH